MNLQLKTGFDTIHDPNVKRIKLPEATSHKTYAGKTLTLATYKAASVSEDGKFDSRVTSNMNKLLADVISNEECRKTNQVKDMHLCSYHFENNINNQRWTCQVTY